MKDRQKHVPVQFDEYQMTDRCIVRNDRRNGRNRCVKRTFSAI